MRVDSTNVDPSQSWIGETYFSSVTEQITNSLDYLHNATNWGLVLISGALLVIIGRSTFPDHSSVIALLITLVLGVHFMCRSARGYINVIRFSLIQRIIIDRKLTLHALETDLQAKEAVRVYHVLWRLPLHRTDVFRKMLLELGYGYLLGINSALLAFTLLETKLNWDYFALLSVTIVLVIVELAGFVRSPYMRSPFPSDDAIRDR